MLKRLRTHHLLRRVALLSISANHRTLWKSPWRRRGGGARAIGVGDNRQGKLRFSSEVSLTPGPAWKA